MLERIGEARGTARERRGSIFNVVLVNQYTIHHYYEKAKLPGLLRGMHRFVARRLHSSVMSKKTSIENESYKRLHRV